MSADLFAAVDARLSSSTRLRVGPSDAYPYILTFPSSTLTEFDLAASRSSLDVSWQTTVVGVGREQTIAARDRVAEALRRWRPEVPGWSCHLVEHYDSQPARRDDDVPDRQVWVATDQWHFVATRTT